MFTALSSSSSSRALIVRGCRRLRRPPSRALPFRHVNSGARIAAVGIDRRLGARSDPPRVGLSTISFDSGTFDFSASLSPSESSGSQLTSHSRQTTAQGTVSRGLSKNSLPPDEFERRIERWMEENPKIAPYKAEEALARMWAEQKEIFQQSENTSSAGGAPAVILKTESVNIVLQAWCSSNNGEVAAERAERLLHWMEGLHGPDAEESGWSEHLPQPNYQSYATVIDAWSRAAKSVSSSSGPASNAAETETKSGGRSRSHVVSDATRAGFECARRAEDVLMHMQRMHEDRASTSGGYDSEIQPDTRVFNLVLRAWSEIQGGTKASAIRAMRILDLMQEMHHVQSMRATEWQGVSMSRIQPNLDTYRPVVKAWARASHTIEGPDRAEEILRHLLSLSKAGNTGAENSPDTDFFHIVMRAHADAIRRHRKGADGSASGERARKVTALLDWMELLALRESRMRPTSESYRVALSAWAWSHHAEAPREAWSVLKRMIRACDGNGRDARYAASGGDAGDPETWLVRPETKDFNTVINCCSFARKVGLDRSDEDDLSLLERQLMHQDVFDIAEGALNALLSSSYARPDSATFSGIIRACINLLPNTNNRDRKVIELFRLAYSTPLVEGPSAKISSTAAERKRAPPGGGCVDANVLRHLRHALPSTEDYIRVREEFEEHRRRHAPKE